MAIDVTCTKCMTRFQVSEKFAGKKGPCPKCKTIITVPELKEQVVVHAPEPTGPKDSKGQSILKPLTRKEAKLSRPVIIGIVASIFVILIVALVLRVAFPKGTLPLPLLMAGAVLLAPPLSFAGYTFLRNDELAPFTRTELMLRLIAPSVVYPAIWALYWFVISYLEIDPNNGLVFAFVIPVVIVIGAFVAQASLDLEFGAAALHYTVYLAATIVLRLILGMSAYWHALPTKPNEKPRPAVKQVKTADIMLEQPLRLI